MPKTKTNFDIVFEIIETEKEDFDIFIKVDEINELNEIRELGKIVSDMNQPEGRFLTST